MDNQHRRQSGKQNRVLSDNQIISRAENQEYKEEYRVIIRQLAEQTIRKTWKSTE